MQISGIETRTIRKVTSLDTSDEEDLLAAEEPLEISISYFEGEKSVKKSISVTMRTPGHDDELALGFLFTEGIIKSKSQVKQVSANVLDENKMSVYLHEGQIPNLNTSERNFYTTSSCGVCGKASIDAIKTTSLYSLQLDDIIIPRDIIFSLAVQLKKQQEIFESTGGLHASALFDLAGNFLCLREDVGRHNALDKIIGFTFNQNNLPLTNRILLLSGRASFELIQKASMAGIRVVAAIGAPSSLAVQLAEESNITLIGFLGKEKFNIYSGFHRISEL
ncbi:formate dehydrogenase accessory sulfurtransferase FdhD [Dyadobacter psychrotolerans]|uniref:Sulfur carrier protein FdhD n=1 Tax=Dyadobacter psychrotolerans TaxID=2541721 RepID=A0A4R5E030_9BACT|nr:formate dehydrogenase accessory sulfurtransferase FdhD [Dyadobacter psychrotolerans]TDE18334.1 formate dehydrogenase accessory sulfurtransferase FdhD [Dyadobacter psychrotolerans]